MAIEPNTSCNSTATWHTQDTSCEYPHHQQNPAGNLTQRVEDTAEQQLYMNSTPLVPRKPTRLTVSNTAQNSTEERLLRITISRCFDPAQKFPYQTQKGVKIYPGIFVPQHLIPVYPHNTSHPKHSPDTNLKNTYNRKTITVDPPPSK